MTFGTEIEQAHDRGDIEHVHHGAENAKDKHPGMLCPLQLPASFQKFFHFPIFLIENLGNFHTRQIFRQVGIDVRGGIADTAVNFTGEFAKIHRKQHHKGHKAQHHQRQGIVDHQHGRQKCR